jgi:hypothetical protein
VDRVTGYLIKNTAGETNRFHVYRPGEKFPAFMLPTIDEAFAMIDLDKAQPVIEATKTESEIDQ